MTTHAQNPSVEISHDASITPIEHKGQRVLTLAMIDKVHCRPEGTASRNFKENRKRFIDGEDFYLIDSSKKDDFRPFGITIPPRGLTVITESGYLLLTKSFSDDLAWKIQKTLIKVYFRAKEITAQPDRPYAHEWISTSQYHDLKHLVALIEMSFHAKGSANYGAWGTLRREYGIDQIKHLPAENYDEAIARLKELQRLSLRFKSAVMDLERMFFKNHFNADLIPTDADLARLMQ